MPYEDPIEMSEMLESTISNLNENTKNTNLNYNTQSIISNINSQILLKKEQLIKMKNEDLNKQINHLQNYESSIINKDRLIDETNAYMNKNDLRIKFLVFTLVLVFIGLMITAGSNKMPPSIYKTLITLLVVIFAIGVCYVYNFFYFRTICLEFWTYRKNNKILKSVKDWSNFKKTDIQQNLYGPRSDWEDENCDCPPDEEVYPIENNIGVKTKPGYYYYDGNAPKQLVVNNDVIGGEQVDVADDSNGPIYDKIRWVDHDQYSFEHNRKNQGIYQITPNNNKINTNGLLVNNSTYTANL